MKFYYDMNKMGVNEKDAADRMKWRQMVGEAKFYLRYKWPWERE